MSILSYSFQGDATERITVWEREIATYERDSGKIPDENQGWCSVAQIVRITVENHLLMRVDKLKMDRLPRRSGCRQGWQGIERRWQT